MFLPGAVAQRQYATVAPWSSEAVTFASDNMTFNQTGTTSRYLSGSCWLKWQGSSASYVAGPFARPTASDPFLMYGWLSGGTDRRFEFYDANGTRTWRYRVYISNTDYTWKHLCWSLDAENSSVSSVYLNGVSQPILDVVATGVHFNTGIRLAPSMTVGYSDFWMDTSYIDMRVQANREKFALGGYPVDLGGDGSTPTGTSPLIFMSGPAADWNALDNKGTGPTPTLSGTITDGNTFEPIVQGG